MACKQRRHNRNALFALRDLADETFVELIETLGSMEREEID